MTRWMWGVFSVAVIGGSSAMAGAQTAIYGEFSGGKIPAAHTDWMYGPTVGLYHDNGYGLLALGYDVRGTFLRHGDANGADSNESLNLLEAGVRAALTPHILPIKPYVEAVGGYGGLTAGQGTLRESGSHAAYQFLGGVDFTFFPRLDWRVVEFSYGGLSGLGTTYNPKTLSTGLVFRLP